MSDFFVAQDIKGATAPFLSERIRFLTYWMAERENARVAKEVGKPPPWTKEPVLQTARFCNVRRMDDKVSKWLLTNWYPKVKQDPREQLAMAGMARLINWPDALIGYQRAVAPRANDRLRWDQAAAYAHFNKLRATGTKIFTGAYIINAANAKPGETKVDVVLKQVGNLHAHPEYLIASSMSETHAALQQISGIGSFIAGQIVADLRHTFVGSWEDKDVWAPLGPGSRRGMAWLQGWDGVQQLPRLNQATFEDLLTRLMFLLRNRAARHIYTERKLEAHDIQNCLCEFDKFMRLKNGTGRAKNKFAGA